MSNKVDSKVAIVGMACRFVGSSNPKEYWENLISGRSQIGTSTRFEKPFKAGFLSDIQGFDAAFFRISPNEAMCMDPQQRILLETVQHAIDDTTLQVSDLQKLRCGVFTTSLPGDYKFVLAKYPDQAFSSFSFLGNAASALSGRISFFYDLKGPSITLDTACSSSLVAIGQACQSLANQQCQAAIVGASCIFSTPEIFNLATNAGMISAKGHCLPFDKDADGFMPGEGAAALVLMDLTTAQRYGQTILGVIEGIGINHDGFTNGLMAPNPRSQAELIQQTLNESSCALNQIAYIETHGTGTKIGDQIEIAALKQVFTNSLPNACPYLGVSKAIIGHTLVCSGLASVIKVLLSFQNEQIPPAPIGQGEIELSNFRLNRRPIEYPQDQPFVAISAFGFTGTNAFMILQKPAKHQNASGERRLPHPFSRQNYWIGSHRPNEVSTSASNASDLLKSKLSHLLGLNPDQIDFQLSLADYGVDSLSAIAIIQLFPGLSNLWSPGKLFSFKNIQEMVGEIECYLQAEAQIPLADSNSVSLLRWQVSANQGKPILLLPPLNMSPKAWQMQIRILAQHGYQVHIPHYPGHDENPHLQSAIDFNQMLSNLDHYITQELKLEKIDLVGWSLGGCLAVQYSLMHPTKVNSLFLINTAAKFSEDFFDRTLTLQSELSAFKEELEIVFGPSQKAGDQLSGNLKMNTMKFYFDYLTEFDVVHQLGNITVPAQYIFGAQDPVIQRGHAKEFRRMKNLKFSIYENQGHFIPLTNADRFNQELIAFLKNSPERSLGL